MAHEGGQRVQAEFVLLSNGPHITHMIIRAVSPRMGMKQGKRVRKEAITILSEEVNDAVEWDTAFF